MKKIIFCFLVLGFIYSCKSTKGANCDAYGSTKKSPLDFDYVMIDTLYLEEEHLHWEEENICSWFPAEKYVIIDTLKVRTCVR